MGECAVSADFEPKLLRLISTLIVVAVAQQQQLRGGCKFYWKVTSGSDDAVCKVVGKSWVAVEGIASSGIGSTGGLFM